MKNNIDENPQEVQHYVKMAQQLSLMLYKGIYVVDLISDRLLYVSDVLQKILNKSEDEILEKGFPVLFEYVSSENLDKLRRIKNKILEGTLNLDGIDKSKMMIIMNTPMKIGGVEGSICNKIIELYSESGKSWIGMGIVAPAEYSENNEIKINVLGNSKLYEYSLDEYQWRQKELPQLSQDEKIMLSFSMSGYSVKEISKMMCKSEDTINFYKKQVFSKLRVNKISEAIAYSTTYCLW